MHALELASLLSSRLCHDLAGPIGAINNGLEILAEEPDADMRAQAIDLMVLSAGQAANRLKYYRLAFGAGAAEGAPIGLDEARAAAQGLLEGSKITLEWPETPAAAKAPADRVAMGLLLNMVAVGSEALPRGGTLTVALRHGHGDLALKVIASGPGASLGDTTRQLLGGDRAQAELTPRSVQPFFTAQLAEALGTRVEVSATEVGRVEIGAVIVTTGAG